MKHFPFKYKYKENEYSDEYIINIQKSFDSFIRTERRYNLQNPKIVYYLLFLCFSKIPRIVLTKFKRNADHEIPMTVNNFKFMMNLKKKNAKLLLYVKNLKSFQNRIVQFKR